MNFKQLKQEYQASLKSLDTEEHIDLWFYRPLGFAWAKLFASLGITPNVVTIASIFLGVAGGVMLYFRQPELLWLNYLGIFLIIWANTYDSADGQLARLTKQYSHIGRILDGVSGDLWFIAIYFALVLRELHFGDRWPGDWFATHQWVIWLLAITAGACHATQAAMADYYRQFHLYFLKGESGSELDSTDALRNEHEQLSWSGDFLKKLTSFFYLNYTANQERKTPNMQALRKTMRETFPGTLPGTRQFRETFRAKSLPLMKYTNMLSFNTRIISMFIAVIIDMPWLYFAFELLVLNAMLLYMILRHENICKKVNKELKNGNYQQ